MMTLQGRTLEPDQLEQLRDLVRSHPEWSRWRLSRQLCQAWNWRNAAGQLKDMAARSLLLKLERGNLVQLPPRRRKTLARMRVRPQTHWEWDQSPVACSLAQLGKLRIQEVSGEAGQRNVLAAALSQFHYLGHKGTVGENLQYLVRDEGGRLLACLLFGSAAWKCRARDEWIGWTPAARQRHLSLITNNSRFLILPWVQVPQLASGILGQVSRRLSRDGQNKYGHPILLVETFVQRDRFQGTAYRAANWINAGSTTGRTRQDGERKIQAPVKEVYLYLLAKNFRGELCR